MFALGSLKELPDLEALDVAGVRDLKGGVEAALHDALGLQDNKSADDVTFDGTEVEA